MKIFKSHKHYCSSKVWMNLIKNIKNFKENIKDNYSRQIKELFQIYIIDKKSKYISEKLKKTQVQLNNLAVLSMHYMDITMYS